LPKPTGWVEKGGAEECDPGRADSEKAHREGNIREGGDDG